MKSVWLESDIECGKFVTNYEHIINERSITSGIVDKCKMITYHGGSSSRFLSSLSDGCSFNVGNDEKTAKYLTDNGYRFMRFNEIIECLKFTRDWDRRDNV